MKLRPSLFVLLILTAGFYLPLVSAEQTYYYEITIPDYFNPRNNQYYDVWITAENETQALNNMNNLFTEYFFINLFPTIPDDTGGGLDGGLGDGGSLDGGFTDDNGGGVELGVIPLITLVEVLPNE